MARSLADLELDPALMDWTPMAEDAPITEALGPRKPLDVSRGAPSSMAQPQQQEPRQDMGGIDALRQAMAQAQQNRTAAELGAAGETISRAFVPQQQSSGFWQRQLEAADRPVQELQAFEKQRGEQADRRLKEAERAGKSAYTAALQQQIQANIEGKRLEAEAKSQRSDANSELSRTWRGAFAQTPEGAKLKETMAPEDFEQLTPGLIEGSKGASDLLKSLRPGKGVAEMTPYQQQAIGLRAQELGLKKQRAEEDRQAREIKKTTDQEQKAIEREAKQTAGNPAQQKDFEFIKGLEDTTRTLEANLNQLEQNVKAYGTSALVGPKSKIMRSLIDDIATGYAKMKDPSTGVKEQEVATEIKKFWDPNQVTSAWAISDDTAKGIIQDLRDRVAKRAERSYEIRGFGKRNTTGPVIPPWMKPAAPEAAPTKPAPTMTPSTAAGGMRANAPPPMGKPVRLTPSGKPFRRATVDDATGKIRYLDEQGNEVL